MSEPIRDLETAVRELGALLVPVGDQPLDDQRLAEIREHLTSTRNWSIGNLAARDLLAEVDRLRTERHSTNEVLSDTAEALREMRDRLAELEAELYTEQAHGRTFLEQRNAHAQELLKLRPRVAELEKAAEQIRFLHKDSPMGPCPVCVDGDAWARDDDPTIPYPCPTARLAGAKDFDPDEIRVEVHQGHTILMLGPIAVVVPQGHQDAADKLATAAAEVAAELRANALKEVA